MILYAWMASRILQGKLIGTDATGVAVLDPGAGQVRKGTVWTYCGQREVCPYLIYDYWPTGEGEAPRRFLQGYEGYLQADAASVFDQLYLQGPVLEVACGYRRCHRGVSTRTLRRDMETAAAFIKSLRSTGRDIRRSRAIDIEQFIENLSTHVGRRTAASSCSSLRSFLRFLFATRRLRHDLSDCVVAPRYRTDEGPPRCLPWEDIRRILRAVSRDRLVGLRDYAMLLVMATYGLGSGEVVHLELSDVDWQARYSPRTETQDRRPSGVATLACCRPSPVRVSAPRSAQPDIGSHRLRKLGATASPAHNRRYPPSDSRVRTSRRRIHSEARCSYFPSQPCDASDRRGRSIQDCW